MSCQFKDECPSYTGWCESPSQDFSRCIPFLVSAVRSREARVAELEAAAAPADPRVLYRCDGRACQKCSPECHLTSDLRHAASFEVDIIGNFEEVSGDQRN